MKIKLLKRLRRQCANRYIAVQACINGEEGWYLEDRNKFLYSGCCATKEIALEELKTLWHEDAQSYINRFKYRGDANYVW